MHGTIGSSRAAALALLVALGALGGDAAARDDGTGPKDGDRRGEEGEERPTSRVLARGPAPAEERPTEEAPAEDAPADEAPAKETPAEEAPAEEPLRKPRSVRHMEVRARDMRLRDSAMTRLESIAARYHAATGVRLVVTGGTRSVRRQAELMAAKLAAGDDIASLYAARAAAIEIRDAHAAGAERGLRAPALIDLVEDVIEAQIARGVYVSLHLQGRAADVRSRTMTAAQLEELIRAVKAEPGAVLVDERDGAAPHFHLKL